MKTFFKLLTGEELSLESLAFYLPTLSRRAWASVEEPRAQIVLATGEQPEAADLKLEALTAAIGRFYNVVYKPLGKDETTKQRKAEIDKVLAWFIHNIADDMGAKLAPALQELDLSHDDFLQLMTQELSFTNDDLSEAFGEAKLVYKVFSGIPGMQSLYLDNQVADFSKEDCDTARNWVLRYTRAPFALNVISYEDAFSTARDRARNMCVIADYIGRANTDLRSYALKQLLTDGLRLI